MQNMLGGAMGYIGKKPTKAELEQDLKIKQLRKFSRCCYIGFA